MAFWTYFGDRRSVRSNGRRIYSGRSVGDASSDVLEDVEEVCEAIDAAGLDAHSCNGSPASCPEHRFVTAIPCSRIKSSTDGSPASLPLSSSATRSPDGRLWPLASNSVGRRHSSSESEGRSRHSSAPFPSVSRNSPRRDYRFIDKTLIQVKANTSDTYRYDGGSAEDVWLPRNHAQRKVSSNLMVDRLI